MPRRTAGRSRKASPGARVATPGAPNGLPKVAVPAMVRVKAGEAGTRSVPPEARAFQYLIKTHAPIAVERATGGKSAERKAAAPSKLLCKRLRENSRT